MVRERVALAIFDDSNLDQGNFPRLLQQRGERAWHTWDCGFAKAFPDKRQLLTFEETLREAARGLAALRHVDTSALIQEGVVDAQRRLIFQGGMEDLARFHLSIVWGGARHSGEASVGMGRRGAARGHRRPTG